MAGLPGADERVIVGVDGGDDAAVFKLDSERALVQTLDIITPVVDDPYMYGEIAAANSLSDVFAMGAEVATALNIVGFDGCNHPAEVLEEILAGGAQKLIECGGMIVGGHTIETPEMLYGLSVTGFVHPERIYRNNTPRIGDVLVLTKPLGMGVLTTAIKADLLEAGTVSRIAGILAQLNYRASVVMREFDVSACTDVTGFGLAGHAYEMSAQRVTLSFDFSSLPIVPEAREMAAMGIIPAGSYSNHAWLNPKTEWVKGYEDEMLFYDAQTSGGLLMAVASSDAGAFIDRLLDEGYEYASVIGEVHSFGGQPLKVY